MEKKYELMKEDTTRCGDIILYRIRSLKDFSDVKKGDLGGYIEKEDNLSHEGDCWIYDSAKVYGNAMVSEYAIVFGYARVYEYAIVFGYARVFGNAIVCGYAKVFGNAIVCGNAIVFGYVRVFGNAIVCGYAKVFGNAIVCGNAKICGDADILKSSDYVCFSSFDSVDRTTTLYRTKNGHCIRRGCFEGELKQFRKSIKEKYGESLITEEYLAICNVIEIRIRIWEEEYK